MNIYKHNIINNKAILMLEKEKEIIIKKIQNSDLDLSLIFSGCGFQFFNNILKISRKLIMHLYDFLLEILCEGFSII